VSRALAGALMSQLCVPQLHDTHPTLLSAPSGAESRKVV